MDFKKLVFDIAAIMTSAQDDENLRKQLLVHPGLILQVHGITLPLLMDLKFTYDGEWMGLDYDRLSVPPDFLANGLIGREFKKSEFDIITGLGESDYECHLDSDIGEISECMWDVFADEIYSLFDPVTYRNKQSSMFCPGSCET
jgi:hypothetical protein